MRYTARAVLAVGMLAGVYLLGAAVVAGVVALVAVPAVVAVRHDASVGPFLAKFGFLGLVTVLAIGRGLWSALRPHHDPGDLGVPVPDDREPQLWREVRELAEVVGTRAPDEIRLVPDVNAAVSEDARLLGLRPGRRRMYLGVPLLVSLTRGQMRSVLAHELGHYSGRHTSLGGVTYRGMQALAAVVDELGGRSVTGRVFTAYARLYHAVTRGVNRRQELEADATSVAVAGRQTAAAALREVRVTAAAWQFFLEAYASRGHRQRMRPGAVFAGFASLLEAPGRQPELAVVRSSEDTAQTGRYDSHPSLFDRLAAIAALPAAEVPPDDRSALSLLADPDAAADAVEAWMFAESGLTEVDWQTLVRSAGRRGCEQPARLLTRACLAWSPDAPPSPADVLEVLRRGLLGTLTDTVLPEAATAEQRTELAADLIVAFLTLALLDGGLAHHELDWEHPSRLVDRHGDVVELEEMVAQAVRDPAAVQRLEGALSALGLAVQAPVPVEWSSEPDGPAGPRLLAALSHLSRRCRYAHLLVLDRGVALLRVRGRVLTLGLSMTFGGNKPANEAAALVETPVGELLDRPGTKTLAWADITRLRVRPASGRGLKLRLSLADGRTHTLRASQVTGLAGDPWEALHRVLGERLDWRA